MVDLRKILEMSRNHGDLTEGYLGSKAVGGKLVGSVQNGKCDYGYYGREYMSQIYDALSKA